MVVHGNGASIGVLKEAGVEDAHLLIAATSRDETNLLTCIGFQALLQHLGV